MTSQPADDARDRTAPPDAETSAPETADAVAGEEPKAPAGGKRQLFRRRAAKEPEIAPPPVNPSPVAAADTEPGEGETSVIPLPEKERPPSVGQLRRRRREIVDQRQEVVYHLGGLAFELYRRDLLTEPVMRRRAAEVWGLDESVRGIDQELDEIDRTRKERREERRRKPPAEPVPAGHCVACGAPYYQPDAHFCWSCGAGIEHPVGPPAADAPDGDEQPTSVIAERPEGS